MFVCIRFSSYGSGVFDSNGNLQIFFWLPVRYFVPQVSKLKRKSSKFPFIPQIFVIFVWVNLTSLKVYIYMYMYVCVFESSCTCVSASDLITSTKMAFLARVPLRNYKNRKSNVITIHFGNLWSRPSSITKPLSANVWFLSKNDSYNFGASTKARIAFSDTMQHSNSKILKFQNVQCCKRINIPTVSNISSLNTNQMVEMHTWGSPTHSKPSSLSVTGQNPLMQMDISGGKLGMYEHSVPTRELMSCSRQCWAERIYERVPYQCMLQLL